MGAQHSSVDEDPHIDAEEAAPEELWLLPMKTLLDFGHLQTFEELQQKGRLVRPSRRKVVLISHEWASPTQPDPKMQQMSVLQHVVRNLCAGRVALGGEAHVEPSQLEMQSCYDWDVWYDYCCLPEARSQRPSASYLQKLYASVDYLVVLAPPTHGPGGAMSLSSHSKSGWCLLDMMAAKLGEKPVLAVTGPRSIFRYSAKAWVREMPHKGQFTKASDQELVKAVAAALLERKRRELYGRNKEAWLFMTALAQRLQRVDCRSLSSFWSRYEMSPKDLAPAKEGFSPLMLAAIEGNCSTLQQLLDGKADPNELRQTVLGEATALCCATMSSLPVIRLLLDAGASPKAGHPMGWAVEYRNLEMMNLLLRSEVHRCAVDGSAVVHLAVLAMDASILDVLLQMGAKATTRSGQFRAHLQDAKRCSVYSTASTTASTSQARKSRWIRLSKSSLSLSEVTARDSERASEEPTVTDAEGPVISVSLDEEEEPGKTQEVLLSTPLEIACYIGHLEMVQLLFHKGADPQERRCKYSALELAEACGHHAIVRFLSIAMQMNSFSV